MNTKQRQTKTHKAADAPLEASLLAVASLVPPPFQNGALSALDDIRTFAERTDREVGITMEIITVLRRSHYEALKSRHIA